MAEKKKQPSILGWWIIATIIAVIAILAYPSVSRRTGSQTRAKTDKRVALYQAAISHCIHKNKNGLEHCNAGEQGIPKSYTSWLHVIRSIHVFQGVIQVSLKSSLGEPSFVYYIPRQVRRRLFSSATKPSSSISWQRIETSYCGLSSKDYNCKNFMKH